MNLTAVRLHSFHAAKTAPFRPRFSGRESRNRCWNLRFSAKSFDIVAAKADAMSTAFLSGPKPGVDYDAMAADAPKITAMLEYIDRSLFQATPAIFAMLIDDKPDRQGMGRLSITRAERDRLVRSLRISFGKKLDQHDQNLIVSSASVLRDYLAKKATNAPMSRCEHPQPQRLPDRW